MKSILKKLTSIQCELKAPKGQFNKFGNYSYRNREDILEALKPLLLKYSCTLLESDTVVNIGGRFYVQATAKIYCFESCEFLEVTSFAREEETKKGMDGSQITGSSSSYARKYALNGLFAIDDVKDADSMDNKKEEPIRQLPSVQQKQKPVENVTIEWANIINNINSLDRANDVLDIMRAENADNATKKLLLQVCKNKGYLFNDETKQFQ